MLIKSEDLIYRRYMALINSVLDRFSCIIVYSKRLCNRRSIPEGRSRLGRGLMHYFCMVLQMHFVVQGHIAPRMGIYDRLTVRIVAEMLAMEVLFEVATTRESFQAISCR
jgi:hypothetical protein